MVTKKEMKKYLELPWTYTIETEKGYYIIRVNELPGVCTDSKTIEKGMRDIKDAIFAAVELYLENGEEVPVPLDKNMFKGSIAYRTSPGIHYQLAKLANREHTSLSKVIDIMVEEGIDKRSHRLGSR